MSEKEEKTRLINSFLSFVAEDLDSVSSEGKRIWSMFALAALGPLAAIRLQIPPGGDIPEFPTDKDWHGTKAMQLLWRTSLQWLLSYTDREEALVAAIYYDAPRCFTWTSSSGSDFAGFVHPHFQGYPLNARIYEEKELNDFRFYGGRQDDLPYREMTFPPGFIGFIDALSGFPRRSLKRCLRCEKIFFAPTNLKKQYCSAYCQKVASVYRSRDKKKGTD